jgi:hypothetical protein
MWSDRLSLVRTKWAAAGVINQVHWVWDAAFPLSRVSGQNEPGRGKPAWHCGCGGLC